MVKFMNVKIYPPLILKMYNFYLKKIKEKNKEFQEVSLSPLRNKNQKTTKYSQKGK
jgi:hypothetical protein